jgi:hypothetical protein
MVMRRLLGSVLPTLLLVAALGACGDEEGGTASDDATPTADGSPSALDSPSGGGVDDAVDFELVKMLTETAAGGAVSEVAVPLGDDTAVQAFTAQFKADALPSKVQTAVAETDVPDGMLLYGAVIAIGCDVPPDVSVVPGDSGLVITGTKVPSPHMECLAAMTTVALVLVPASAVS